VRKLVVPEAVHPFTERVIRFRKLEKVCRKVLSEIVLFPHFPGGQQNLSLSAVVV
jgi:hypothetical protein